MLDALPEQNWIDTAVVIIVIGSALLGARRGLFASVAGIVVLVLSLVTARQGIGAIDRAAADALGDSPLAPFVASVFVFFAAFFLFGMLARWAVAALRKADVGGFNRVGGVLLGLVRGGLLSMLFALLLSALVSPKSSAWQQSKTLPLIGGGLKFTIALLPPLPQQHRWLSFDAQNHPLLVQPNGSTAGAAREKSKAEQLLPALEEKTEVRDEELDAITNQLRSQANVRSEFTDRQDERRRQARERDSDFGEWNKVKAYVNCELAGKNDCRL